MPDVDPGLYRHYKGNLYRVLFLVKYDDLNVLGPDEDVAIVAYSNYDSTPAHLAAWRGKGADIGKSATVVLVAKNSTDGPTPDGSTLVTYVALYGDGRVSVREIGEFTADVMGVPRFARVEAGVLRAKPMTLFHSDSAPSTKAKTCMACSYCGMGPDDPYPVCGHPDAGQMGLFIKSEPLPHCPDFSKFKQHPGRNPNGTLKSG